MNNNRISALERTPAEDLRAEETVDCPFLGMIVTYLCNFPKYSKICVTQPLSKRPKIGFQTNYCLMQVKSIA